MPTTTSNPIVVVTGANTGIGFATVRELITADQPYTVILCSRDLKKGQDAADQLKGEARHGSSVVPLQLDTDDDASIERFVQDVRTQFGRVDILINNAGITLDMALAYGQVTPREAWNRAYNTNTTSTHLLTTALMPLLFAASSSPGQTRILFISSNVGSHAWSLSVPDTEVNKPMAAGWPKPPSFSLTAYRSSKSAMGMMYREWCRTLANDPIKCHYLCPGFVATNLGGSTPDQLRQMGAGEPSLSSKFFREVIEGKYDEHAGLSGRLVSQGQPLDW